MLEYIKYRRGDDGPNLTMFCTQSLRDTYVPLSKAGSWYEYYIRISDKDFSRLQIPEDLRPVQEDPVKQEAASYLRYGTCAFTVPLTIIAALECLFPDLAKRTSISLHLLGADPWELEHMPVFEEILHLLPSLKRLELTLVGLDIPEEGVSESAVMIQCCPSCSSRGRTRPMSLFRSPYHESVDSEHYEQLDLAVAFHSGFSQEEREDWAPTIRHLSRSQHPSLFTTYNEEEMHQETTIISRLGAKFVQEGRINRWKAVCPLLDPMAYVEKNIYFSNYYCYIVSPRAA